MFDRELDARDADRLVAIQLVLELQAASLEEMGLRGVAGQLRREARELRGHALEIRADALAATATPPKPAV